MAKAAKRTTKKRKSTKKKAIKKAADVVAELEEQAQAQAGSETSAATAVETPAEELDAKTEALEESVDTEPTEEESTHAKYERIKKGNLYLTDLQKLTVAELHDLAKNEGITEYSALKKNKDNNKNEMNLIHNQSDMLQIHPITLLTRHHFIAFYRKR